MKKFIRKYITANKKYEIGDIVDIKDEKLLKKLEEEGTIKEFKEVLSGADKRVLDLETEIAGMKENSVSKEDFEALRKENEELKSETVDIETVKEIMSILTLDELDKFASSREITTKETLKDKKVEEILKAL